MGALQLRRGLKANLATAALTAAAGEPLIATDTRELYIGKGVAEGGGAYKVSDVVFSAVTPTIEVDKVWVNTADNEIYRVNDLATAWVKISSTGTAITINTDVLLGRDEVGGPSDTVVSSQKAVKTYVDNAIAGIKIPSEWPDSVIDEVTVAPGTPNNGDRYLVGVGATGLFLANDGSIAQWSGTAWVFTVPTTGTFLSVDSFATGLYYYGGTTWTKKNFELNKAGDNIDIAADGTISVNSGIAGLGLNWNTTTKQIEVGTLDAGTF